MDKNASNKINDCFVDVIGRKPSAEEISKVYSMLPQEIKSIAIEWGGNDSVFGDKVFSFISDNKKNLE